jgi:hypothetical protein
MNDEIVQFLPFHALNDFMRPDFRLEVVRTTLNALSDLPENFRSPIDRLTKKVVHVPGFRNSVKAPTPLKVRPMAEAFEKSPDLVAAILSAWAEVHTVLRQQVYDLLIARGWEVLPPETDRTKLPGFLTRWPKGEDFDVLNAAFEEKYPETKSNNDEISLMIVWLSSRLPYHLAEDEESGGEAAAQLEE